jgi:thioredoxin reductase
VNLATEHLEFLVIGAGPAGLCAAAEAAAAGVRVTLVDESDRAGGQLPKQIHRFFGSSEHGAGKRGYEIGQDLYRDCLAAGLDIRLSTCAVGFFPSGEVMLNGRERLYLARPDAALVATGASEKSVAFPGWTLPGVMGAGAAQTLVNIHRVLPGRRVVMAGSGNVGLIVAYQLVQAGCEVAGIVEPAAEVGGYAVHADRVRREGIPIYLRHGLLAAEGEGGVEAVYVRALEDGRVKRFRADVLCLAVGLSPLVELLAMAGCELAHHSELGGFVPRHDEAMRTTRAMTYVAGDASGVEEASIAMEEGRMSGIAAAEDLGALGAREAAARRAEIAARLQALRSGPYGYRKLEAKRRLYAS